MDTGFTMEADPRHAGLLTVMLGRKDTSLSASGARDSSQPQSRSEEEVLWPEWPDGHRGAAFRQ
eukprot:13786656-Alexandrium_andersonii.AAC.1